MKEFFGFGGYQRAAEGFLSWQHLTFVSLLMVVMVTLAAFLGKQNRSRLLAQQLQTLKVAAVLIDGLELFKIVLVCIRGQNPMGWLYDLPLFLCSIQLITIPMAAFGKGRMQEAALDFVAIFGILGAVLGTYGAGNNYGTYPVLCFDNVVSGLTHSISGFASLYILTCRMAGMKKRNMGITFTILLGFCVAAYAANLLLDYNYMFLMRGDGTPYEILYSLCNGNRILYPLCVIGMFLVYITAFYQIFYAIAHTRRAAANKNMQITPA